MKAPNLIEVRDALYEHAKWLKRTFRASDDICTDVRLQVYPDGEWALRTGLSDYDQDHHGYWGSASVARNSTQAQCKAIAQDLIDQAMNAAAEAGEEIEE